MTITFSEIAVGSYFTNKQGKLYRKMVDNRKKSFPLYRETTTNPKLVVTPLYDVPVIVKGPGGSRLVHYKNKNGKYHRIDGPAVTQSNGDLHWYHNGDRHRTDGPAINSVNGHQEWWVNGQPHRTDGPAVEYADGRKAWWINGTEYDQLTHWLLASKEAVCMT